MSAQSLSLYSGVLLITLSLVGVPASADTDQEQLAIASTNAQPLAEPLNLQARSLAKVPQTKSSPTSLLPTPLLVAQSASEEQPAVTYGISEPQTLIPPPDRNSTTSAVSHQAADLLTDETLEMTPQALEESVPLPEATVAQDSQDASSENVWERSQLTGDWGGARSQLADSGVTFDLYFTQFLQGAVVTSGSREFNYGGRFDALINFDTEKLGLWDGGSFNTHLELRYGGIPQFPTEQGALWPVNTGTAVPLGDSGNLVASSLYLSQQLGDVSLLIGKINVIDLLANDLFFGGWGAQRFSNVSFVAPPSGVLPPTIFGAITNVNLDPVTLTFMVFDPNDQTNNYWPNDLFGDGVNLSAGATYATTISDRPTTFNLTGTYSTKTGADLNDFLLPPDIEGGTRQGSYAIAFQFTHLLQQLPDNPREGWGVYFKGTIADGNPNIIQGSAIGGIGGKGLFANRPDDRFGLGFFYWNFSNELENTLEPLADFGDEYGLEAYYSYAVTPWFHLTGDVQYINPVNEAFSNALFLGLRAGIRF
jgi:porin